MHLRGKQLLIQVLLTFSIIIIIFFYKIFFFV